MIVPFRVVGLGGRVEETGGIEIGAICLAAFQDELRLIEGGSGDETRGDRREPRLARLAPVPS